MSHANRAVPVERGEEVTGYPPEPWALRGELNASLFLVPIWQVPLDLPPDCRPIVFGDSVVVGTAWVRYDPSGVLAYRELMATVLVRRGRRPVPTITSIWVDSPASRDGGRALWGIPKDLAGFDFAGVQRAAATSALTLATGRVRRLVTLPGRWPVRFAVAQTLGGRTKLSPVRATATLTLDAATFRAGPDGPLGFLAGRRPVLSVSLRDFAMSFGG